MNIFKEMALSIYSYKSYSQFIKNKKVRIFGFGVLLMTIYFLIAWALPAIIHPLSFSSLQESFLEEVPDFTLQDGVLWVNGTYEEDTGTSYIYVNTAPEYTVGEISELEGSYPDYTDVMLIDSEKLIQKSGISWQITYFSDIPVKVDKQTIANLLPKMGIIMVAFYLIAYIMMTALFFFGVLFVALCGRIITSRMNRRLTFGQLYIMAIYSRTFPLLLKAVISILPVTVPFFEVINFGMSVFIMAMAITQMKDL